MDRRDWRVMTRIHVAGDREQAYRDVTEKLFLFDRDYFAGTLGRPFGYTGRAEGYARWCAENGSALIGGPEDVRAGLRALWDASGGGFGGVLLMGNEFAPPERMRESYELFARYVMPHFSGALERPQRSHASAVANRERYNRGEAEAIAGAIREVGVEPPDVVLGARLR